MQKTVLITGASSGFGFGLVSAFLNAGWHVIATCRRAHTRGELFERHSLAHPDRFFVASLDVTSADERDAIAKLLQERFSGRLDCLVNNAGYGVFGALEDLSEQQIIKQMDVNFTSMVLLTRQLLPFVRAAKGRIINFSSVMGYMGMPLSSMYSASKYAIEGFSECLYHELKPYGVKVSIVEPGGFKTNFLQNLEMGQHSGTADSAYLVPTKNYIAMRQKMSAGKGTAMGPVIKATMYLSTAKSPPLRVRCGRDAMFVYWMQRLLPSRLRNWLYTIAFSKALMRPGAPDAPRLDNA